MKENMKEGSGTGRKEEGRGEWRQGGKKLKLEARFY